MKNLNSQANIVSHGPTQKEVWWKQHTSASNFKMLWITIKNHWILRFTTSKVGHLQKAYRQKLTNKGWFFFYKDKKKSFLKQRKLSFDHGFHSNRILTLCEKDSLKSATRKLSEPSVYVTKWESFESFATWHYFGISPEQSSNNCVSFEANSSSWNSKKKVITGTMLQFIIWVTEKNYHKKPGNILWSYFSPRYDWQINGLKYVWPIHGTWFFTCSSSGIKHKNNDWSDHNKSTRKQQE